MNADDRQSHSLTQSPLTRVEKYICSICHLEWCITKINIIWPTKYIFYFAFLLSKSKKNLAVCSIEVFNINLFTCKYLNTYLLSPTAHLTFPSNASMVNLPTNSASSFTMGLTCTGPGPSPGAYPFTGHGCWVTGFTWDGSSVTLCDADIL